MDRLGISGIIAESSIKRKLKSWDEMADMQDLSRLNLYRAREIECITGYERRLNIGYLQKRAP